MRYALALVAVVFAWLLVHEILNAIRSYFAARWHSTPGRLVRWDIHADIDAEDTRIVIRDIAYSYCVAGKDYQSSRLGFGFPTGMSALYVEKTLKRLLRSAPDVLVFFDPANPQKSALSVGIEMHHLIRILGFSFVVAVVLAVLYGEP